MNIDEFRAGSDLDFSRQEPYEKQLQNYWSDTIKTHLENKQFANEDDIRGEIEFDLFQDRDRKDLENEKHHNMTNLRDITIKTEVPIIQGIKDEKKTAKIEVDILFRLIIDDKIPLNDPHFQRSVPDLDTDSYFGDIRIKIE